MLIVGCDFHPGWQQIAVFDSETGEVNEYKLSHGEGEAEQFYRQLPASARIGLESNPHPGFESLAAAIADMIGKPRAPATHR